MVFIKKVDFQNESKEKRSDSKKLNNLFLY